MSDPSDFTCDHCGEPELYNVLCADCEQLCCPNGCTGRVNECVCEPADPEMAAALEADEAKLVALGAYDARFEKGGRVK